MDWCKVFMWIASICVLTAMVGERFLPQLVVVALAFVGNCNHDCDSGVFDGWGVTE
jgi:hypothetical protein